MNAPRLRFSEFNDEWKIVNLSEILEFYSTNSLSREQLSDKGLLKNIHYGDIHKLYNSTIKEDDIIAYVKDINFNKYTLCKTGDLLIADASEDYEGIGKATEIIEIKGNNVISGLHTIHARDVKNKFALGFKGYYFNSPIIHNQIRVLANGFKVFGISKNTICNLKTKIPSISEQTKIVKTLELLDKKIELQSKKIEDLKLYKKGLFYKLFYKFKTRKTYIKELGHIVTGTTPAKSETAFWDHGNITWVTPSDINEDKDIYLSEQNLTNKGLNKGRFIPKNSILVTCIASIGKNAILKVDGSCNQQINAIIPYENYNYDYIYYLINNLSNYMQSIAGTSATSIINKEAFSNIEVDVHNYDDQIKISNILNKIETKILLEKNKLNKLQQLKKGLMQSMFV